MNIEFEDAVDKLQELSDLLSSYQYEIHYHDNSEYQYLSEEGVCITIPNPYSDDNMYIDLDGEFTLTYSAYHEHYAPDMEDYDDLTNTITSFLKNELCSAVMYYGEPLKWLGSTCITKTDSMQLPIKSIFSYIFKIKEFKNKINTKGGEVHYNFWNPVDNRIIKIEKKI